MNMETKKDESVLMSVRTLILFSVLTAGVLIVMNLTPKTGDELVQHMGILKNDKVLSVNGVQYESKDKAYGAVLKNNEDSIRFVTVVRKGRSIVLKNSSY